MTPAQRAAAQKAYADKFKSTRGYMPFSRQGLPGLVATRMSPINIGPPRPYVQPTDVGSNNPPVIQPKPPPRILPVPMPPTMVPGKGIPGRRPPHGRRQPPQRMPPTYDHRRAHRRPAMRHRRQRHPAHLPPPVYVPPTETAPVPIPVPIPTGPMCPSWGWMVRTNADGSETVVQCQPGQRAAAGLHGLDGLLDDVTGTLQSTLGPNWMLYLGGAAAAYFLFFRKRR